MPDASEQLPAALAGRYTIVGKIGSGGMADVYLADDLVHGRRVAIKVLLPEIAHAIGSDRFRREIEIARRFSHPRILPLYDSGDAGGSLYYVMPYMEGETLRAKLERERQLPIAEALAVAAEVADALEYAHHQGVVHRDIKPENILFEDGHALVADFGAAHAAASAGEQKLTQTGVTLGTPLYMSPEQATAERVIDGRADIYSLGCVLYEMLCGAPPFSGASTQAVLARHALEEAPLPTIVRGAIPAAVEAVVLRALEKVPADRYQTAGEFAAELRSAEEGAVGRLTASHAARRLTSRRGIAPRWPGARWLAAVGALALIATGVYAFRSPRRRTPVPAADAIDPRRIAVLYFTTGERDSTLGLIADGLTEGLIAQLGDVEALSIVSRGGVARYRGDRVPAESIARALQAGTLVRGTVERDRDRIVVSVRLVDGASGADFDRAKVEAPAKEILAVRDSLSQAVARLIRSRLGAEVRLRAERQGARDPEAWVSLERGKAEARLLDSAIADGDSLAMYRHQAAADSFFARASALDPSWPDPEIRVAFVDFRVARSFADAPPGAVPWIARGLAHADSALALAPSDPDALEVRGNLRYWRYLLDLETDPRKAKELLRSAREDLERATKLSRSQAGAWASLSHLYAQDNDLTGAKLAARTAYETDAYLDNANTVLWRLFTTSYDLEQFPDAVHWCTEGGHRFPREPHFQQCELYMMWSGAKAPDVAAAWRAADSMVALTPPSSRAFTALDARVLAAGAIARAGLKDSARHVIDRIDDPIAMDPTRDLTYDKAVVYNLLGDRDRALNGLAEYIAASPGDFSDENHWMWRNLRDDPRYRSLVRQQSKR